MRFISIKLKVFFVCYFIGSHKKRQEKYFGGAVEDILISFLYGSYCCCISKGYFFSFCHYCNHFNVVVLVRVVGGGDGGV